MTAKHYHLKKSKTCPIVLRSSTNNCEPLAFMHPMAKQQFLKSRLSPERPQQRQCFKICTKSQAYRVAQSLPNWIYKKSFKLMGYGVSLSSKLPHYLTAGNIRPQMITDTYSGIFDNLYVRYCPIALEAAITQ